MEETDNTTVLETSNIVAERTGENVITVTRKDRNNVSVNLYVFSDEEISELTSITPQIAESRETFIDKILRSSTKVMRALLAFAKF